MPSQVTGASQTALNVYQALYGQAPSNPLLADYKSTIATSGAAAFASQMTAGFAKTSSATLASTVLTNLGVYTDALSAALTQMFDGYGVAARGQILLNITTLLSNLEGDTTYGAAASAFNAKIGNNFTYASNTANTTPGVYTAPVAPVVLDPTYSITTSAASVAEGGLAYFTVNTKNVAAGTTLSYSLVGAGSAAAVSTTGVVTVDSLGKALIGVSVPSNALIGDTGSLTLNLTQGASASTSVTDASKKAFGAAEIVTANGVSSGIISLVETGTAAQTITLDVSSIGLTNGLVVSAGAAPTTITATGPNNTKITVVGTANNVVTTDSGNDIVIISGSGNNTVNVGTGSDTVTGGTGNDTIVVAAGALGASDLIDGGVGSDTVVISGNGNVVSASNLVNVENLQLNGTTVTFNSTAAVGAVKNISGSSTTSEITITATSGDTIDLTALSLTTLKSIKLDAAAGGAAVTVKANAANIAAIGAITKSANIAGATLSTDVAGVKALTSAFTGITAKTVTDTVSNLIAGKSALTGATLVVSGNITAADVLALNAAGLTSTKTVSMSVADLLVAAQYPDQLAALTAANTLIQVTGNATVAQAATLVSAYGTQIAAYQAAATGNKGIALVDTPAAISATYNTTAASANVSSITLTDGLPILVADAGSLVTLTYSGGFSVKDTATNLNAAISSTTALPARLSKASSVQLSSADRVATNANDALELSQLGSKLIGGFDYADSVTNALSTNGLIATAAAAKATLTGTASVAQLNTLLSTNAKTTVAAVSDTPVNLIAGVSSLSAVNLDLVSQGALTVSQAATLNPVFAAIAAKTGSHTLTSLSTDVSAGTYTNKYVISDVSSAIVDLANAAVVKGATKVTASDAMTLAQASTLQALAAASNADALAAISSTLVYNVTDTASALAAALSATSNTAAVGALAGATTVTATGTATIDQAKVLGTAYSAAVQVDTWAISADKSTVFSSGSTLSTLVDANTDPALLGATSFSVTGGALSLAQVKQLKTITTGLSGNAKIFDNVYSVSDTAANIAAAISDTTVTGSTTLGAIDIATLNAASSVSVTGTVNASQATQLKAATTFTNWNGAYSIVDTYSALASLKSGSATTYSGAASVVAQDTAANINTNYVWVTANTNGYNVADNLTNLIASGNAVIVGNAKAVTIPSTTVTIAGLTLTSGSASATCTANSNLVVGMSVVGTGIPAGATISAVASSTAFTLSANATATASGTYTAGSGDAGASSITASHATSLYNANRAASYSVADSATNLVSAAGAAATKVGMANASSVTVSNATTVANIQTITAVNPKTTYSLSDTYAKVAAQPGIADGASSIDVSDSSLTVAKYANLLAIAGATSAVSTTVAAESLVDTAANVNGASAAVLTAASGVTLTDVGALTLTVAQARGLENSNSNGWKLASSSSQPAAADATVKVVDTSANIIAAKTDVSAGTSTSTASGFLLNASNTLNVTASDTATLTVADATTLLSVSNIKASYLLSDTADNLVPSNTISTLAAGARSITVNTVTNHATTAAQAKAINDANPLVVFDKITDTAAHIGTYSSGYTYATAVAKASAIVVGTTESVADVKAAKAASGSVALSYGLSDTAANLVGTDGAALLSGASALVIASSGVATAAQSVVLGGYVAKFGSSGFAVTDSAANLAANLSAVKAAIGTATVSSTATVAQFQTLKAGLGAQLATTNISDTAANVANFLIAGTTTGAGTYTLSGSLAVNAAQEAALAAGSVTSSSMVVSDTSANLLSLADSSLGATFTATDTVDLVTAKQLMVLFETGARFNLATTSDRFVAAYSDTTVTSIDNSYTNVNLKDVLKQATTISVDGTSVVLGASDAVLAGQSSYSGKIIGTAATISALPTALKTAAGYVIVDTVANITSAGNAALVAAGSGYVIKDTAANLLAAAPTTLASATGARGVEVLDATSVATISTINASNSFVSYNLSDTAAHLTAVTGSTGILHLASAVTVTGTASAADAHTILASTTGNSKALVSVVDTGANLANTSVITTSDLGKLVSIVADADLSTAGNQGILASEANAVLRNKASGASFSFNVVDSASNLSTAIGYTGSTDANAATLSAAGTVSVTATAATAAQAKNLAKITVTGGYTVTDTAANLTTSTTVGLTDLAKATTVKVTSGTSGTGATYAQAVTLEGLANMEKDSNGKYVFAIADSAKALASASSSALDAIGGTITVSYSNAADVLTAAQASALLAVDAASSVLSVTGTSLVISDTSANILASASAAAVAASRSITVSDAISTATLAAVKTAGGTADSEVYAYKLIDSAANLLSAGTVVIDKASSVQVSGTTSVGYADYIDSLKDAAVSNSTVVKFDVVSGTANQLFGTVSSGVLTEDSSSTTVNSVVTGDATSIHLTDATSVARAAVLKAATAFDGVYAVKDTAANLVTAINGVNKTVLDAATSVALASGEVANVAQATVINNQLANEGKLALVDTAANLSATAAASVVAAAASVVVDMGTGNDALANPTTAKVTYLVNDLNDMIQGSTNTLDVLTLKTGDAISLTTADFDGSGHAYVIANVLASLSTPTVGSYDFVRGFINGGTFVANANGPDCELIIHKTATNATGDYIIALVGVTSLTPDYASGSSANIVGFHV